MSAVLDNQCLRIQHSSYLCNIPEVHHYLQDARLPRLMSVLGKVPPGASSGRPYQASIRGMRLRLLELQAEDSQAWKTRAEKLGGNQEDLDGILHHQGLPYVPEIIRTELISRYHDDSLAGHFGIEKTRELVTLKYYQETLRHNVKVYVRGCDVCLASKAVRHKPYKNLQQLQLPTYR